LDHNRHNHSCCSKAKDEGKGGSSDQDSKQLATLKAEIEELRQMVKASAQASAVKRTASDAPLAETEKNQKGSETEPPAHQRQESVGLTLLRCFLTLLVFLCLHTTFNYFVLDPFRKPAPQPVDHKAIMRGLCPPGAQCEF